MVAKEAELSREDAVSNGGGGGRYRAPSEIKSGLKF